MGKFNKGKQFGGGRDGGRPAMYKAVCSACGRECEVPFRPTGDRPVFCNDCFKKQGGGRPNKFGAGPRREGPRFEDRQMYDAVCAKCGAKCQVPFKPMPGKMVYCNNCFDKGSNNHSGNIPKSTSDYAEQFKMLNQKLDKLIGLMAPKISAEKSPEKKIVKEAKKTVKTKPVAKKASAKKKK